MDFLSELIQYCRRAFFTDMKKGSILFPCNFFLPSSDQGDPKVVSYGQCDQRSGSFDLSRASSSAHEFDPYFTERSEILFAVSCAVRDYS